MKFTQCKIKNCDASQTVWLPSDKVKLTRWITLKDDNVKKWWQIVEVFSTTEEDNIKDSHDSKRWFKNDCFIKFGNK